jgi:hypothetical protein
VDRQDSKEDISVLADEVEGPYDNFGDNRNYSVESGVSELAYA